MLRQTHSCLRSLHLYLHMPWPSPSVVLPYSSPSIHWLLYFLSMSPHRCPRFALGLHIGTLVLWGRRSWLWLHPRWGKLLSHHPWVGLTHHPCIGLSHHPLLHWSGARLRVEGVLLFFGWERCAFVQGSNIITRAKQLSVHNSSGGLHLGLECIT